jgi:hypothetical protein
MDTDSASSEASPSETTAPGKTGRPPLIILTSAVNLIQLQKQLKGVVSEDFEFRSTRNGTRVIMRGMADFQSVKSYFDNHNLSYFSFFPKNEKPVKALIRHLPHNTPAQDISDGMVSLGFDVINVKQMTTTRQSKVITLPLFLITLPRTPKSQEIFRLSSLCHIAIRVVAYRSQNSLMRCHNCQQFGHVWANCKQPPRCLWCGGGHLHKECPEKNTSSTPACCNCRLVDGEKLHPANYRGCSHVKEELQKKLQRAPKITTGRVFSSVRTTPGISFVVALRGSGDQQQQPQANQVPVATPPTKVKHNTLAPALQQTTGQSVQAPNVSSHPSDNMSKVVTVVQQIMTEVSGALSEEEKIVAITKIVVKLMNQNGH